MSGFPVQRQSGIENQYHLFFRKTSILTKSDFTPVIKGIPLFLREF